ncbi:MAG TPA: YbhN family protein [Beijerinckiaceae bacterium]|nr:YbhN family protein [Beijerinckiaceae bacterium]
MKRLKEFIWPIIGLVAVVLSVRVLYQKLYDEAAINPRVSAALEKAGWWDSLKIIARVIGQKLAAIPPEGYLLAFLSTLAAYAALAWYDRIALLHLRKEKGISWLFISACSFTTYALSHNIGASVVSGGAVRYRAYTSKGLTGAEVAVLVALCSFTFAYGTLILTGLVLVGEPHILTPLLKSPMLRNTPVAGLSLTTIRIIGLVILGLCALYVLFSWMKLKPLTIRGFTLEYPRMEVVVRQLIAAPLELIGAAGIIYFALPDASNPGFFVVLGAFLLSFSAGLLAQVPGGVGVMEAVFIAVMPGVPASSVFAALLVWRLFYLLLPLALSIPIILAFEEKRIVETIHHAHEHKNDPPPKG